MANYGRDIGENFVKANEDAKKAGIGLIAVTVAAIAGARINSSKQKSNKQLLEKQIENLDQEIADLSTGFLATWRNSDAIEKKKLERAQLQEEYNKYK